MFSFLRSSSLRCCVVTMTVGLSVAAFPSIAAEPYFVAAHWSFDEGMEGEAAVFNRIVDLAGEDQDGIPINAPTYRASPHGLALDFNDGTRSQSIFIQDSPAFQFVESFTVEAVFRARSSNEPGFIVYRGGGQENVAPFVLSITGDLLNFTISDREANHASATYQLPSYDAWYHVAAVFDTDAHQLRMYVDGSLKSLTESSLIPFVVLDPTNFPGLVIANSARQNSTRPFNGLIDDMRISQLALVPTAGGFSIPGDATGDGTIDLNDLNVVRNTFGSAGAGDANADGIVDLIDLNLVRNHFGEGASQPVPEPSSLALLTTVNAFAFGSAACLRRYRR